MSGSVPGSFWETAVQAAIRAGEIITDNIGRLSKGDIGMKGSADFVTRTDREAEDVIIRTIREGFPGHSFLAEESARDQETGGYRWIIDPLDGTTNFIHGYPMCAVSIALQEKGGVILGVIYNPIRDELFMAEKGKGAFLNGEQITVSQVNDPGKSLIATGFPFR